MLIVAGLTTLLCWLFFVCLAQWIRQTRIQAAAPASCELPVAMLQT
jgi:hypothetical protein